MTCRYRDFRWATVLLLCIVAAGSISLIYLVAGRCAMGGADINISRVINSHKLVSMDPLIEWEQPWPSMTTSLSIIYSKVYPKVSTNKPSIAYDATTISIESRAFQRAHYRDAKEMIAFSGDVSGGHAPGSNASDNLHIQF